MATAPILRRRVEQAERRLLVARAVAVWPWTATGCFVAAVVLIAVDKYWPLGVAWTAWLAGAAGVSVVAALAWTWWRRGGAVDAAVELDRRCRLAERVSSALALESTSHVDSPAAEAVRDDAERALAKVEVAAVFPLRPSRSAAWPILPALAAVAVAVWLAPSEPAVDPAAAAIATKINVKESTKKLETKLAEKQRLAEELKLSEAQKLLEKLQEEARRLRDDAKLDQKEALVKLNDLAQQLEDRRKSVAGSEQLKKALSRLKPKETGPAEQLARALSQGDYQEAIERLQRLREQLNSDKLDEMQKQQLAKQLDELEKQIGEMAQRQEERHKEAERRLAEGLRSKSKGGEKGGDRQEGDEGEQGGRNGDDHGGESQANPSPEELAALSKQAAEAGAQSRQLQQLQRSLEQAANSADRGDTDQLQKSLDGLRQQLSDLAQQNEERKLLDDGLQDLAQAKADLGEGNSPGQEQAGEGGGMPGEGNGPGGQEGEVAGGNQGGKNDAGQGGSKPGDGTADNENPTVENDKNVFDARVRPKVGEGPLRVVGPTDGPNAKGRALQAIQEQAEALADGAEPQPVANQSLDRSRRAQKRQYFDALRQAD